MKISRLNKRIGFYSVEEVANEVGDLVEQEVMVLECWAAVKEQYASEVRNTIGTILEDSVQFLVRGTVKGIETKYKLKFQDETYEILKINRDTLNNGTTTIYAKRTG